MVSYPAEIKTNISFRKKLLQPSHILSYYKIHLREYIFLFAPEAIMKDMRAP